MWKKYLHMYKWVYAHLLVLQCLVALAWCGGALQGELLLVFMPSLYVLGHAVFINILEMVWALIGRIVGGE